MNSKDFTGDAKSLVSTSNIQASTWKYILKDTSITCQGTINSTILLNGINKRSLGLHTCVCEWQCWRLAGVSCSLVHNKQQVLGLAKLPSNPRKRHTCAAWQTVKEWRLYRCWCVSAAAWWQILVKYSLWWELRRWFIERTQENVTALGCRHTIDDDAAAFLGPGWRRPLALC